MKDIAIFGANGRMGRTLIEAISRDDETNLCAATVRSGSPFIGMPAEQMAGVGQQGVALSDSLDNVGTVASVVIDFTLPQRFDTNLSWCVDHSKPLIVGTTGLSSDQLDDMRQASRHIPIVFAANYSIGVNVLLSLVRQTARILGDTNDIEIIEAHHRYKRDAPSGTALALGQAIADELNWDLKQCGVFAREGETGERQSRSIGFATVRGGDIVGEHTALFADIGERLELTHKASSRMTFAKGALTAAKWAAQQEPGLYSMEHVLGLR